MRDLQAGAESVWDRFKGGRDGTLWYYRSLVALFKKRRPGPLTDQLAEVVDKLDRPLLTLETTSCPRCGSSNVRPIVYGLPDAEMMHALERGEIVLGGCILFGDDPEWECQSCRELWSDESPEDEPPGLVK